MSINSACHFLSRAQVIVVLPGYKDTDLPQLIDSLLEAAQLRERSLDPPRIALLITSGGTGGDSELMKAVKRGEIIPSVQDLENLENSKIERVQALLVRALCPPSDCTSSIPSSEESKSAPLLSRIACLYGFEQRVILGYQTPLGFIRKLLHLAEGDRKTSLTRKMWECCLDVATFFKNTNRTRRNARSCAALLTKYQIAVNRITISENLAEQKFKKCLINFYDDRDISWPSLRGGNDKVHPRVIFNRHLNKLVRDALKQGSTSAASLITENTKVCTRVLVRVFNLLTFPENKKNQQTK